MILLSTSDSCFVNMVIAFCMIFISLAFNGLRATMKKAGGWVCPVGPRASAIGLSPYGGRSTVITRSPIAIRILVLPFLRWTVMDIAVLLSWDARRRNSFGPRSDGGFSANGGVPDALPYAPPSRLFLVVAREF